MLVGRTRAISSESDGLTTARRSFFMKCRPGITDNHLVASDAATDGNKSDVTKVASLFCLAANSLQSTFAK